MTSSRASNTSTLRDGRLRRPSRPDRRRRDWPSRCRCRFPSPRRRRGSRCGRSGRSRPRRASSPRRCRNSWCRKRRRCRRQILLCARAFSSARCRQIGCFSSLSRISGVRIDDFIGISGQRPFAGLQCVAAAEFDRVERQGRRQLVDQHLQRGHRLQRPIAAHRSRRNAARMLRHGGNVDLRVRRRCRARRSAPTTRRWRKNSRDRRHRARGRPRMRSILPLARSTPIRVRILKACRLMPPWNCW